MKPHHLLFAFAFMLICSCSEKKKVAVASFDDPLIADMDSTVKPNDDFYMYASGGWMKRNPIPGNERSWGIWSLVQNETYNRMKTISEDAAKNTEAAKGSNAQKIGDFWAAGMDTTAIEKEGLKGIATELASIDAITDVNGIVQTSARLQTIGVETLYGFYIYQDEKNSEAMTLHLGQGGLGLPDRDYYFNTDGRTAKIRAEYPTHVANMFKLMGNDDKTAEANSATVMKIETALAKASRKLEDLRDPYKNYNKYAVPDMNKRTSNMEWNTILSTMNIYKVDSLIIGQPEFFTALNAALKSTSINDWKVYMRWQLINEFASYLSSNIANEHFRFYGTVMSGVKEQRPRWKRILDVEEGALGDALGQLYVEKYVSPSVKKRYDDLTNNIFDAYRDRIKQLTWMSDATKTLAIEKLNSVTKKVGYPDKWKDYSSLVIDRGSYVGNCIRANNWQFNYQLNKLGKPVDRTEWDMTPQTYNAYYNPSNNEIVLPAAIFIIPGLEDSLADDAIIYGYAGASTIGHEITHGFDDQGRQFDSKGNLRDWWTPQDGKEYIERAKKIVAQFDDYKVLDSLHINGSATQGENIADLGGVVLGLEAFKKTEQYKSGKKINGLTPVQRYYLGYALSWLGHQRDESLANRLMTDVHSPNFARINGPVVNSDEFYEAFNIKPGDKMYRPDSLRVRIW
ncbi:MAG: M13 family metallopeptidase [Bacteroidota bacterium]